MKGKQQFGTKGLFCAIFFLGFVFTVSATPVIERIEEVEGTCVSNCGIIIHATNLGTNVRYGLINYPTMGQTRTQTSNVFTNLEAGTYTIGVYDNTTGDTPVTGEITITTSYIDMFLSTPTVGSNTSKVCVDNGTLTISFTGGSAPFRYKIEGPVTREVTGQTVRSYTFSDLPSGSYTVEVQDICDQWRRNKPESPVVVTSAVNPYKDLTFQSLTITRSSANTYFTAAVEVCTRIGTYRLYYTDAKISLSNGTTVNGSNSTLRYYIESPANSNNWSTATVSGTSYMYFYNIPYSASDRTYRMKVVHPCTGVETISGVLTFPDEPTTFRVSANSNSGTYTDFCTMSDNPSATVSLYNTGNDVIRSFGCGTFSYTLKKDGDDTVLDDRTISTATASSISYSKSHGLVGGQSYTVYIKKDGVDYDTVSFTAASAASMPAKRTDYRYSANTSTAGYNYGKTCDFEHTRVVAYRTNHTGIYTSGKVKYEIISYPDGYDGVLFPAVETSSYSYVLWDNLPYGTYTIRETWEGCEPFETTVSIAQPFSGFKAQSITYVEDASVCGMFTLQGKATYLNASGVATSSTSSYARYYMQIVEGPKKSDGTPTVGLRSAATYSSTSYTASISNLPGGEYKVIFYSTYQTPSSTYYPSDRLYRYSVPNCYYDEKETSVKPYFLPKLNIPMSGGISCSPTGGQATLTITGQGDASKRPFLYRYKVKGAADDTYYPADFSSDSVYQNLNAGGYTVQVLDQCGNIGTQNVTIYNSGDQIIEIIGGVNDENGNTTICRGQPVTLQVKSIGPVHSYQWSKSDSPTGPWESLTEEGQHYFYRIESVKLGDEGYYRVSIDNTSCIINSSVHIVAVNEPAPAPSITGPTGVCLGTAFTLQSETTVASPSYQWYRNGVYVEGVSGNTLTTSITGSYTVVVIPPIGCPSNASVPHVVAPDPNYCVEASDDTFEMNACGLSYINVLENDRTLSCSVAITVVTGPNNGSAVVEMHEGINKIKYTPSVTFTGVDELTYKIACGSNESSIATVRIYVKSALMLEVRENDNASEPNKKGRYTIRFTCSGVRYSKALNVKYTVEPMVAVTGADFVPLTGTIQIPANTSSVFLELEPINNYVVEGNNRTVKVTITEVTEVTEVP